MLRVIRECSPRWIVGENVLANFVIGTTGLVFEEVCADLETCGYSVQPFVLPAAAVNAPHRRDRVWFVAHSNERNDGRTAEEDAGKSRKKRIQERKNFSIRKPKESNSIRQLPPDTTGQCVQKGMKPENVELRGEQNVQQENRQTNSKQSGTMGKDGNAPNTDGVQGSDKITGKENQDSLPNAHGWKLGKLPN